MANSPRFTSVNRGELGSPQSVKLELKLYINSTIEKTRMLVFQWRKIFISNFSF